MILEQTRIYSTYKKWLQERCKRGGYVADTWQAPRFYYAIFKELREIYVANVVNVAGN